MRHTAKRHARGLGLLEVLIALSILAVGIIGAVQLFPAALAQARRAQETTISAEVSETHFNTIRATGADFFVTQGVQALPPVSAAAGLYTNFVTNINRLRGAEQTGLQRVTISIRSNSGQIEEFVTYISRQ